MASQLDNLTTDSAAKLAGDKHKEKLANAPLLFFVLIQLLVGEFSKSQQREV